MIQLASQRSLTDGAELDGRLRALLREHGGRVMAVLESRWGDIDEHLLQQSLADAALKVLDTYDSSKGPLGGWFVFLACREVVTQLRQTSARDQRTTSLGEFDFVDSTSTPLEGMRQRELAATVREAVRKLSQLERSVIEADLDAGGKADAASLAKALGIAVTGVYGARRRARRKLTTMLSPELLTS